MKGKVKFFNSTSGFGFIIDDDGKEYFVHKSKINEGTYLNEDDVVEFEPSEGERGPIAVNVSKNND